MPQENISASRYYTPEAGREHITALFMRNSSAENAINHLEALGVPRSAISVILRYENETADFAATTETGSKASEGAGAGSIVGSTVGAILGALAATATSVAIPGVGVLLAGPIAGALAGAGAGGLTGSLLGALVGAGIPEEQAKTYEAGLQQGGVVVVADVSAHMAGNVINAFSAWGGVSDYINTAKGHTGAIIQQSIGGVSTPISAMHLLSAELYKQIAAQSTPGIFTSFPAYFPFIHPVSAPSEDLTSEQTAEALAALDELDAAMQRTSERLDQMHYLVRDMIEDARDARQPLPLENAA